MDPIILRTKFIFSQMFRENKVEKEVVVVVVVEGEEKDELKKEHV